ncbi:MAG: asparagine synthase (glutamine-hydrolyzing), partial [Alphaproteobacteria bacterium]
MCGIAGYLGPTPPSTARIEACEALMVRRGPDANGRHSFELAPGKHALLLHSRLSIIDLDPRANQPMRRGDHVVATNGELYNYRELRDELRAAGATFKTQSDTEVLLAGIEEWGLEKTLDRGEGMWAFAALDEAGRTLTLVRDRFGEKPLYLMQTAAGLYFGSEPKFLFALAGTTPSVNRNHLTRFLVNGYKALHKVDEGFFDGVEELPPGTSLTLRADGSSERARYWSWSAAPDPAMGFDDAVAATRGALIDAVGLRLRADVPLAFCLSGGVDSNAIVAIARREFDADVHGFTILNTDARYEEQDMVDLSVAELGIRHTGVPLSTDGFLGNLRTLVHQHDAPVYTISYYVHWLLMQAVADAGYRISLSGTAADELFTGYY